MQGNTPGGGAGANRSGRLRADALAMKVLGWVLIGGAVLTLGGRHLGAEGYDLLGVRTGSEGRLGVVTEVTVRLLRKPETARAVLLGFPTTEQAGDCVAPRSLQHLTSRNLRL